MFPNFQSRVGKLVGSWMDRASTSIQVLEETVSSTAYSLRYHFGPEANKAGYHDAQVRATRVTSSSIAGLSRVSVCLFFIFWQIIKLKLYMKPWFSWGSTFLPGKFAYIREELLRIQDTAHSPSRHQRSLQKPRPGVQGLITHYTRINYNFIHLCHLRSPCRLLIYNSIRGCSSFTTSATILFRPAMERAACKCLSPQPSHTQSTNCCVNRQGWGPVVCHSETGRHSKWLSNSELHLVWATHILSSNKALGNLTPPLSYLRILYISTSFWTHH